MGATFAGKLADPEFRKQRATNAANKRTTLAHHVQKVVDNAPQLSAEQRDRLAILLRPSSRTPDTGDAA
jgi:hypothetical protein